MIPARKEPKALQDRKLYWVSRNRTRTERAQGIGGLVSALAAQLENGQGDLSLAAEAIDPAIDDDFRHHCTVGAVRHGVLVLHVDSPALVAPFRLRWVGIVLSAVQQVPELSRIRRVTFEYGSGGVSFRT